MPAPDDSILAALLDGPASRPDLQARIGGSQPTLARALGRLSGRVHRLGRGRATRYALRRPIRELADIPVFRVDVQGHIQPIGLILPVQPGGLWYEDREHGRGELFPGLPWFLADMRPQGFLGRLFARRCRDRGLPERLSDWNDDHALYALATLGEDAPGNLVLGEESHQRWQGLRREGPQVFSSAQRTAQFQARANAVLAGESPGSSAGGEQQKFGAAIEEEGEVRHYIVKFSPPYGDALGRRWADLLVWEHLAKEAIRQAGLPAAQTQVFDDGQRLYLQVLRFDRSGAYGRRGVVSLGALDDAFIGQRRNWSATAEALARLGWMTPDDAARAAWLEGFGRLIANTDMHFGNLSLLHEGERPDSGVASPFEGEAAPKARVRGGSRIPVRPSRSMASESTPHPARCARYPSPYPLPQGEGEKSDLSLRGRGNQGLHACGWSLSPAYDMLPMAYAPRATGEVADAVLDPPALPPQAHAQAVAIFNAARNFWGMAEQDERVSANGRAIAGRNAARVGAASAAMGF